MQKLTRNIGLTFRVTEAERDLICKNMKAAGISNLRAYLLKMAVNGIVINLDLTEVSECARLLRNISNNINQIAVRTNSTGNIYSADIVDIQAKQTEIWQQQDKIVRLLTDILEVA